MDIIKYYFSLVFANAGCMARERLRSENSSYVRNSLNAAVEMADGIHKLEKELVIMLKEIDLKHLYVRSGQKSLRGFCSKVLNFSETQSQRIVTLVRRSEPTPDIGHKGEQDGEPDCYNGKH